MKKGALADCVFAPQAFRYGLDAYIHLGAGTGGEESLFQDYGTERQQTWG